MVESTKALTKGVQSFQFQVIRTSVIIIVGSNRKIDFSTEISGPKKPLLKDMSKGTVLESEKKGTFDCVMNMSPYVPNNKPNR